MRLALLFNAVLSVVICNYDENSYGSSYPWSHGVTEYNHGADDWWYDSDGQDSHASGYLAATSPFYLWFKNAQMQYDTFAPAKHVGKINRGKFLNPELNLPADRAIGHKSDFLLDDFVPGAFEYRPRGQKIRAREVDVIAGIASSVGEIIRLPLPVYVKNDGTLLVNVFGGNRADLLDACTRNPNPCADFPARPRCVPLPGDVNTVKCMGPVNINLELRWFDPEDEPDDDDEPNNIDLFLRPSKFDGTACSESSIGLVSDGSSKCGATLGADKQAMSTTEYAKETALLTSSPHHYSYAVYAIDDYNLNSGRAQLILSDDTHGDMRAVQIITVPQGNNINIDNKPFFFFGCFRPDTNKIDMKSAGFYKLLEFIRNAGLGPFNIGVCNKLRRS